MAVTTVQEIWKGQTWSDDKTGARSYVRVYQVHTDDAEDDPNTIRLDSSLPLPFSPYPSDPAAVAVSREAERAEETRLMWTVSINYEFNPEEEEEDQQEDPTARPAKIRWTSSLELEAIFKDKDGNAIVNSAGDYFDPPVEWAIAKWQVNVQKNMASIPTGVLGLAGAINNAAYTIDGVSVEAFKSRLIALDIGEQEFGGTDGDIPYRVLTMGIEFSRDEYKITPLDQGYRYKDTSTLKDILVTDEDGKKARPSAPVLLDGEGAVLADPTPTSAVFLEFDPPVSEIDFNTLPLS